MKRSTAYLASLLMVALSGGLAQASEPIRVGVMAGGTLAWELAAMQNEGLLNAAGFEIDSVSTANPQAGKVALQAGSVDIIISDWIWVSGMRAQGSDLSFYPYSDVSGSLLVPAGSPIKSLQDLQGKRLGIAGGELDKNWLLLQALAQKQGFDLNAKLEKVYGAPPILNQQLKAGRIDALLTYWHFAAHLKSQGYQQLLSGEEVIKQLGVEAEVPQMGYVFKSGWAERHKAELESFFALAATARNRLCGSEIAWQRIVPLTGTESVDEQILLRQGYCAGRVERWGEAETSAAQSIYQWLRKVAQNKLTDKSAQIEPGTFWSVGQ